MAKAFYKRHFTLRNLYPLHDFPTVFVISQWSFDKSQPSITYLIYRTAVAVFFITTWSMSLTFNSSYGIFLTNLGYIVCTLQATFAFIIQFFSVLFSRLFRKPNLTEYVLKLHPVYWLTHVIAASMAFTITVIYWTGIYDRKTMGWKAMDFYLHGCNTMFLMVDVWVIGHPVRILHFFYPLLYGMGYAIFSIIYYFYDTERGGSGYIYPILKWNKPQIAIFVVIGTAVLIIVFHLMTFGIHLLKLRIYRKIYLQDDRSAQNPTQSTEQLSNGVI